MAILKQNEAGASVADLCGEHGISAASVWKWRTKIGGMDASLIKRMEELEDENRQGHYCKKVVKPARRRELACRAKVEYDVSIRVAFDLLSISTTCYFYKPTLVNENVKIEDWLKRLTTTHKRCGFGLCFDFLRNTKGFKWNHKLV